MSGSNLLGRRLGQTLSLLLVVALPAVAAGQKVGGQKKATPAANPAATTAATSPIPAPAWPEAKRQAPADLARDIDRLIEARLAKDDISPSPLADDAEFLRRAHLDLIGRVPTPERAAAFLDSTDPDKRSRLIDELLAHPEYGKHFANVWHDLIIPRIQLPSNADPEALRRAFVEAFNANLPWSDVAARVALCENGTVEKNFLAFYRVSGDVAGNAMANVEARNYARLFLGIRMDCAECHNDPYKPWKQDEYWGLAAFFGRVSPGPRGSFTILENATTGYKPPKGSLFRLPSRADGALPVHHEAWRNVGVAMRPKVLGGEPVTFAAGQSMVRSLVHWVTAPDNPYLAPAAVNRLWAHFFARGFVNPVDDFHADNEPSHPELLRLLAEEFMRSRHDLKHLIRCVCNSRTYQRTSRPVAGNNTLDDLLFSRMPLKVLTSEMLLDSLAVAYDSPELFPRAAPPQRRGQPTPFTRRHFVQLFNTNDPEAGDPTEFTHGIPQVLHLMNVPLYNAGGNRIDGLLKDQPEPARVIETLYLATLSRRPTPEEMKRKLALVAAHQSPREGLNGVLWTLVNQAEFTLNH